MVDEIDTHVGERIRTRRLLAGMSQHRFASQIGVTFQQIQKYEKGANRISASRLYRMARVLNTPISYFFEDIGKKSLPHMLKREGLELVRAYNQIAADETRRHILFLVRSLSEMNFTDTSSKSSERKLSSQ